MKIFLSGILALVLCCLLGAPPVFASFRLPGDAYQLSQLEDATKSAKSMHTPIAFLVSDVNTVCPLASRASEDAIKGLRGSAVIVYVDVEIRKNDWAGLPLPAKNVVTSPEAGKFIPVTVITDADSGKVMSIIPYIGNSSKRAEEFKRIRESVSHLNSSAQSSG